MIISFCHLVYQRAEVIEIQSYFLTSKNLNDICQTLHWKETSKILKILLHIRLSIFNWTLIYKNHPANIALSFNYPNFCILKHFFLFTYYFISTITLYNI